MRWSGGIGHACKFAGVVAFALVLAACSRHGQPREYGLGATDSVASPRRAQGFCVHCGVPASRSHNAEGEALPQFLGRNLGANDHDIG